MADAARDDAARPRAGTGPPVRDDVATRERRYRRYLDLDTLFPYGEFEAHWIGDDTLWYVACDAAPSPPSLRLVDLATRSTIVVGLDVVAAALGVEPAPMPRLPFERIEQADARWRIVGATTAVLLDPRDGSLTRDAAFAIDATTPGRFLRRLVLAPPTPVPDVLSPDGRKFATVRDGDVWVVDRTDGSARRLTDDARGDVGWDLESGRRPFARTKAPGVTPWSPDDTRLFALRIDRTSVRTVPLIDFLGDDIRIDRFHVEASGTPMPQVAAWVFDVASGAALPLDLGDCSDALVLPLGWMPDGGSCWFARFTRTMTRADVIAVDARTGEGRIVFTEQADTFVRIQHDILYPGNAGFAFLPDSSGFLWLSERSGWNHVHRVDRDGHAMTALTDGPWRVQGIEAIDATTGMVFFTAHSDLERPYDTHLHCVPLAGGPVVRLTEGAGQHEVSLSPSRRHFVDTHASVSVAPTTVACDADGRAVMPLARVDVEPLVALGWTAPEEFAIPSMDGRTMLWGVIYRPADFDASRRYPVAEHIYAGPQVAYAQHGFGLGSPYKPWNQPQALAQLGFVVVVLDTEGTPGRSKRFHDDVHGAMGRRQVARHAAALRELAGTRPWMDIGRVGIFGHSWGGLFAVRALAEAPDLYRAAVASGAALTGNNLMSEPYLGTLAERPEAYAGYDAIALAPKIRGALLLVTGTAEVSMFHDAMRMTHALIEAGVRHELIVLPGQPHGYSGKAADYFLEASTRFLQTHLGTDRAA